MNGSLSEMFVQFLREESIQTPIVPLPAEEMAQDQFRTAAASAATFSSSAHRSSIPSLPSGSSRYSSPAPLYTKTAPPPATSAPLPAAVVPLNVPDLGYGASPILSSSGLTSSTTTTTPYTSYSLISPLDPLLPLFSPLPPKDTSQK